MHRHVAILMLGCASLIAWGDPRTWTATNGSTVEAEFVSEVNGVINLKNKDGKPMKVMTTQLSAADVEWIAKNAPKASNAKPAERPEARASEEPAAVMMKVKRLQTIKDVEKNWQTSWGSYDRDYSRAIAVEVSVRNTKAGVANVKLEVLFVAKSLSSNTRWIFDRVVEDLAIEQSKPYLGGKISKKLEASVQNYAALGQKDQAGAKIEGYIVRLLQGDSILAVQASMNYLQTMGKDQKTIDAMIKAGEEPE